MIKLVRLDYRLLHGQVVFSWTGHVGAQRIIVVDDDAANDEMKKSALLLSKPAGVRVNIFTVDKAIAKMPKVEQLDEKIMMIFGNLLAAQGAALVESFMGSSSRSISATISFKSPLTSASSIMALAIVKSIPIAAQSSWKPYQYLS